MPFGRLPNFLISQSDMRTDSGFFLTCLARRWLWGAFHFLVWRLRRDKLSIRGSRVNACVRGSNWRQAGRWRPLLASAASGRLNRLLLIRLQTLTTTPERSGFCAPSMRTLTAQLILGLWPVQRGNMPTASTSRFNFCNTTIFPNPIIRLQPFSAKNPMGFWTVFVQAGMPPERIRSPRIGNFNSALLESFHPIVIVLTVSRPASNKFTTVPAGNADCQSNPE